MQGIISPIKSRVYAHDTIPSFIRKTYDILEEAKFPDIIDWNPEGTALVIKKTTEFCQKVLPTYFKHSNLTSFVRQLNMYNFHKRRTQTLDHVYYHELFQRGKKYLLSSIKRKTHNDNNQKAPKTPETSSLSGQTEDLNSLLYENQYLKQLYHDSMAKLNYLEKEVQGLTGENQSLLSQISQNKCTNTQGGYQVGSAEIYPPFSSVKVGEFINSNMDDSRASTEPSYNSPNVQYGIESDKLFQDHNEPIYGSKYISKNETLPSPFVSMNHMKHTPTFSVPGQYQLVQGAEKGSNLNQHPYKNSQSLLGKRQAEVDPELQAYEPLSKRTLHIQEDKTVPNPLELSSSHFNWSLN